MSVERRASGSSRDMVTAPKTRLVQKQPHLLAYITPAEAALLKKNGGTGEMVNGIPAFPRGSVSKSKVDKAKAKTSTKSAPAPRNDRQPVAKSTPAPAPKERNDRQPVAPSAPAPRNDRQPVAPSAPAPKTLTRSITVPAPPPKDDGPSAAEKAAAAAKVKALADAKCGFAKAKALADAKAKEKADAAKARVQSLADDAKEKADAADAKEKADAADAKEKADAADAKAKSDAKAKADAKVAEEKRIKDQLAADAKKAKAALAVEKAPAIKGKYLPAGSTTDKRGLTMDTAQNPRLDKNGNVVSAEDAKYLNFMDMIDGGGPGRAGPEFQTKSQAKDSPTGGEKTGTIASFVGATPLNSGIEPTGIAGFVNSGGIIGSIMNSVLGPDTRTEEEKAAALLLQQQQMERDSNRDSDQPNLVVDSAPPGVGGDPSYSSTPISSGMYGNVGQVSAQDLMVGGNQTSQELLNAPRALPTGEIPFSEPTQEEMFARINDPARRASIAGENAANPNYTPPGTLMANNGPAGQLASIYGPPGQVDPMYPGATPYQVGPQMASVYGQPVNGTLPGSYNPLAAQQAAPVPAPQAAPTFADLYGGGQQQLPGQPYYGIMG
jgi:hypothetical protein